MAWFGRKKDDGVPVRVETTPEPAGEPEPAGLPAPPEANAAGLRSVADHTAYLLSLVEPLPPFGMSLLEAYDQVVKEDISCLVDVPANSTSRIDGYAVRVSDLFPGEGDLVAEMRLASGEEWLPLGAVEVVRAGEVLPKGANAVLPSTYATTSAGRVRPLQGVSEGEYVRAAGEHLAAGTPLLSEGEVLSDRGIGLLASAGIDKVLVRPRPRVVVISSGEGLVDPGMQLSHGETMDANSFMVAAAARAEGATVFRVAVGTSRREDLARTLTDQLIRADLVISTTGGRREDYEAMVSVMSALGLVDSVDVAMSPGRTQTFGLVGEDRVPMLMLPGNPVSAYASFHAFGRPLIRKLAGTATEIEAQHAIAQGGIRSHLGHLHLLRGRVSTEAGMRRVVPVSRPYALGELSEANAFIVLDESTEHVQAGERVKVWMFGS
ncbi:MAG TPA: molybdopterin molybdotransferase MoeA [Arachnia sp.]|nr:molybdopterin molybdotransferase MoeA [Arachnia sp.]HMT87604.1 molybdopterin molybdotransferase MoeA [Arachnia sp.]